MKDIGDRPGCQVGCNAVYGTVGCATFRLKMDVWIVTDEPGGTHCFHPRGSILVVGEKDVWEVK